MLTQRRGKRNSSRGKRTVVFAWIASPLRRNFHPGRDSGFFVGWGMGSKRVDLTGKRFGRLMVISRANTTGRTRWKCKCDCGSNHEVAHGNLQSFAVTSCGCLSREIKSKQLTTHGMFGTRIYNVWAGMKKRCKGTSSADHKKRYHDRGIRVCSEWMKFEPFKKWADSNGYSDELTIDRIDNNGPYSPQNCKFSTAKQQANNRSSSVILTLNGKAKTIREWEESVNMKPGTIRDRLDLGWDIETAIFTPLMKKGERLNETLEG